MRRFSSLVVLACLRLVPSSASAHHRDWHGEGNSWSHDGDQECGEHDADGGDIDVPQNERRFRRAGVR